MLQLLKRRRSIIFIVIGVAIVAFLPEILPSSWTKMLTQVLIMALFATGLNMEMGYAGMMPLAQGMFLGIGAYSFSILIIKLDVPFALAIVLGLIISVIINIILGYLCLRGSALTFGLLHMAFGITITTLIAKWIDITGGDAGIAGVPRPGILVNNWYFYLVTLGVVLICYFLMYRIVSSPFGKIAQGLRENEERLRFIGINTKRYQLTIFVLAGFFAAIAGILLSILNQGAFPSYASLILSAQAMMMCLIGGAFSFWGPSLGSALVIIFSNQISNYTKLWQGALGTVMVVTVLALRGGILRKRKTVMSRTLNKEAIMTQGAPTK
jgi:branched-chain amino acid transport system permease protein